MLFLTRRIPRLPDEFAPAPGLSGAIPLAGDPEQCLDFLPRNLEFTGFRVVRRKPQRSVRLLDQGPYQGAAVMACDNATRQQHSTWECAGAGQLVFVAHKLPGSFSCNRNAGNSAQKTLLFN